MTDVTLVRGVWNYTPNSKGSEESSTRAPTMGAGRATGARWILPLLWPYPQGRPHGDPSHANGYIIADTLGPSTNHMYPAGFIY